MNRLGKNPILASIIIVIIMIIIGTSPVGRISGVLNLDYLHPNINKSIDNISIYTLTVFLLIYAISKFNIRIFIFNKVKAIDYLYLLPALIYLYIFSGANSMIINTFFENEIVVLTIYTLDKLLGATFEEILFRGLVLSLMLYKFIAAEKGLLKSVLLSSLIFGLFHIINYWTINLSIKSVYNQVFATFCIGVLWSAIYLKTRNIVLLIGIHFISNYFAMMERFVEMSKVSTVSYGSSTIEFILEEILRIFIYGAPFLIGLFIIRTIHKDNIVAHFHSKAVH